MLHAGPGVAFGSAKTLQANQSLVLRRVKLLQAKARAALRSAGKSLVSAEFGLRIMKSVFDNLLRAFQKAK